MLLRKIKRLTPHNDAACDNLSVVSLFACKNDDLDSGELPFRIVRPSSQVNYTINSFKQSEIVKKGQVLLKAQFNASGL